MLKISRLAEDAFVVFALLFYSGVIPLLLNGGIAMASGRGPIQRLLAYVVQFTTIILIVLWHKRIIRVVIKEKLLWALVVIPLVSVLWSDQPSVTIGTNQNLIRLTLFGVYFGARYNLHKQMQLLAWVLGIGAFISIVCVIALPSYGVMGMSDFVSAETITHQGKWQGIYGHKNVLGRAMSLSTLVFLLFTPNSRKYCWVPWAGFLLSMVLILGSTSKTSLVIILTIVVLSFLYRSLRWKYSVVIPFLIALILVGGSVATLLVSNAEAILGLFGRDLTLTGRTELWAAVLDKISERPWLGYGFGAFWRGLEGQSADVWNIVRWEVPHSHNGYLDIWLDLGLLGFSTFVFSFILVFSRSVNFLRQSKTKEGLLPLIFLTFLLMANLTESSFFREEFLWSLYVAVSLLTHQPSDNITKINHVFGQKKVQAGVTKEITSGIQEGRA